MILIGGGLLSAAVLDGLKIKGVEVPLIYEKEDSLPLISMQVVFRNSGSLEDGKLEGLAKFSSKILNEGSKSKGSVGFATALEDRAIHFSAGVGAETLVLEISALKEQFGEAIKLIKELLSEPNLTKESFDKVKLLMKAKIKRKESDFDYIAKLNLKLLMYEGTAFGHPFIGTLKSLDKIELTDVESFLNKHLVLKRAIVLIGGDLSKEDAKSYSTKLLEDLGVGEAKEVVKFKPISTPKTKEVYKDTKQAYIYFGSPYNLPIDSKERYKAKVAAFILGAGGFGSRMMEEIRVKRGLAYSAYSRINFAKSHSDFRGYLQTKLESKDEAIKIVKTLISDFVKKGVTQEELDQAKRFLLGSEPLRSETLSQRLSRAFNEYYNGFKLGYTKEELSEIESLKLKDLNKFIASHDEINNLTFSIVTKK
jgi:predicted Zn-dependent peptidase